MSDYNGRHPHLEAQVALEAAAKNDAAVVRRDSLLTDVTRLQAEASLSMAIAVEAFSALSAVAPQEAATLLDSLLAQYSHTARCNGFVNVSELLERLSKKALTTEPGDIAGELVR